MKEKKFLNDRERVLIAATGGRARSLNNKASSVCGFRAGGLVAHLPFMMTIAFPAPRGKFLDRPRRAFITRRRTIDGEQLSRLR